LLISAMGVVIAKFAAVFHIALRCACASRMVRQPFWWRAPMVTSTWRGGLSPKLAAMLGRKRLMCVIDDRAAAPFRSCGGGDASGCRWFDVLQDGRTALARACMAGQWSVARWLIDERDVDWVGQSVL
jgi:hypothetical protein